jgi:uncharacterized membrane protein (DUF106 family)
MIDSLNYAFRRFFDTALSIFRDIDPWTAITALSLVTALLMLLVYRVSSDQRGIRAVKDKIIAHLLEMRLYRNSLPVSFRAQGRILWYNLKYLGHSARPMLVMILPLALAIVHMDQWFSRRPLGPGESAIVKVRLKEGHSPSQEGISVEPSRGFLIETPPLRIDSEREIDWRVRAVERGNWDLVVDAGNQSVNKQLVVAGNSLLRLSTARAPRGWLDQLANPGEAPIPEDSVVRMIEIDYPARQMVLLGWRLHWLVVYLMLSIAFGFVFKGLFKVEV